MAAVEINIKGKVQGVWFRKSAKQQADTLRLQGWVRNNPDGSVSLYATGAQTALDELIAWCRQGPPQAVVSEVLVQERQEHTLNEFTIERDP